jgi:ankyrin repeat protein
MVEFLLGRGVSLQSQANTGQTALDWAVIGGQAETITLLLSRGADLEAKNAYGGTALGQALWSAAHSDSTINYQQIAELLKLHGAKS